MSSRSRSRRERPSKALVYSCSGAPGIAQLAEEIAERLRLLGVAEVAAGDAAESGSRRSLRQGAVIAIDGCSSACCTRSLEARGVRPASIGLHELGVGKGEGFGALDRDALFAEVLARLDAVLGDEKPASHPRARGAPRPKAAPRPPRSAPRRRPHSIDDYLQAIYELTSPVADCGAVVQDAPTLAAHVSQVLGVSRPTAGEMVERLQRARLVARGAGKQVLLTAAGRAAAERAVRRHRIVERFLTDFLGCPPAAAYEQARDLGDAFDDEMVERIAARLGNPERCPHGWPVDPAEERAESPRLAVLAALEPGARGTVARLGEHDADVLAGLYAQGLVPGAAVEVCAAGERPSHLAVRVGRRRRTIACEAAAAVYVRVAVEEERPGRSSTPTQRGGARGTRAGRSA